MSVSAASVADGNANKATVMVRLTFNTADELYWGLISPKQTSRTLTPLIITLLKAYLTNETVRDIVDGVIDDERPENQIKKHFASLIELQAQASRYIGDLQNTLGSTNKQQITNPFNAGVQNNIGAGTMQNGYSAGVQQNVSATNTPDLASVLLGLTARLDKIEQSLNNGVQQPVVAPVQQKQSTFTNQQAEDVQQDKEVMNELLDFMASMNEEE